MSSEEYSDMIQILRVFDLSEKPFGRGRILKGLLAVLERISWRVEKGREREGTDTKRPVKGRG